MFITIEENILNSKTYPQSYKNQFLDIFTTIVHVFWFVDNFHFLENEDENCMYY